MIEVRPAKVADASAIVEILREGFPRDRLAYTIFGCHGVVTFVGDCIGRQEVGDSFWCVACRGDKEKPLGFAEFRRSTDTLFLNQLFVAPPARGCGIGTRLVDDGLLLARNGSQVGIACDVFVENVQARRLYLHIGMRETFSQSWVEVPLDGAEPPGDAWYAAGLAQASRLHCIYGFSQFTLHTPDRTYAVGRLGEHLFRVTDAAMLSDGHALAALSSIDPGRSLLCIDRSDAMPQPAPARSKIIATSVRLQADYPTSPRSSDLP